MNLERFKMAPGAPVKESYPHTHECPRSHEETAHTTECTCLRVIPEEDYGEAYWFWCPGCETHHSYRTKAAKGELRRTAQSYLPGQPEAWEPVPLWTFNGNMESPSFSPSLLYSPWKNEKGVMVGGCHLYLTNGELNFLGDCNHKLAGQKVPLVQLP